jgi:hypothetical protein
MDGNLPEVAEGLVSRFQFERLLKQGKRLPISFMHKRRLKLDIKIKQVVESLS